VELWLNRFLDTRLAGWQAGLFSTDAHLKNFAVIYTSPEDARLSPMFDVVTTSIYPFERPGGVVGIDRTLALKWRSGKHHANRAYPTTDELLAFGRSVCGVTNPQAVVERIAQAMGETLRHARRDERIDKGMLAKLGEPWESGRAYAS